MKYSFNPKKILFIFALAIAFQSCSDDDQQTVVTKFKEVWSDEFDGNELDTSKWNFDTGNGNDTTGAGWGNNELQYYTDRPENIKVEDGMLVITAQAESYQGSNFTSARINTQGIFSTQYGRIETRMKLPWGKGIWPAFWMLGDNINEVSWPQCGEIDIMENRGQEPTIVNGTIHGPGYNGANAITKSYELENSRFDTDFHVFGIEWNENYINYYVDDVLYNQIRRSDVNKVNGEWVFNQPFFIVLNLAVGGNYVGNPSAQTEFPQTLYVDYVRVYK